MENIRHAIVSVDVVVFAYVGGELKVALKKVVNKEYDGKLAFPGALMKPTENAALAVTRVLKEKMHLDPKIVHLEELGSYSELNRDVRGRVVSIAYIGFINNILDISKLEGIEFLNYQKVKKLAYDHDQILKDASSKLRTRFYNSTISSKLLSERFTMKDFLELYNLVLKKEIDKRNFAKKIKTLKIVKPSGGVVRAGKFRPAKLFKFNTEKVVNLEIF